MIFASDLDRTLIYSPQFLQNYSGQTVAVETGKYYSYMTKPAAGLLQDIARQAVFVPCTTRTIEQYQRIQWLQKQVTPPYVVLSNGANILLDGVPDIEHRAYIARALQTDCLAGEEMLKAFHQISGGGWVQSMRQADGVFYYCIIDRDKAPLRQLRTFGAWAAEQQWSVSMQGRKLYLVPKIINKWQALKRIVEMTGEKQIIGAGDSWLDMPLLEAADYAILPAHGELYEQLGSRQAGWHITNASGLAAGEEILRLVIDIIENYRYYRK